MTVTQRYRYCWKPLVFAAAIVPLLSMLAGIFGIAGMIILAVGPFIPYGWEITDFVAILPMAMVCGSHLLLPIALNPALMTFTF